MPKNRWIHKRIEKFVRKFVPEMRYDKKSLRYVLLKRAVETSADFIEQNMPQARPFETRGGVFKHVLECAPKEGLILEFGVRDGTSIRMIARLTDKSIHGFDSFEGLPDDGIISSFGDGGQKWYAGKMDVQGNLPKVPDNVSLHKGWFDQTLPKFYEDHGDKISFMHIDCDIYSSTRSVLEISQTRIVSGSIIVFDDYLNYFGWQENEHKALVEFSKLSGMEYEFIAYNHLGGVAIRVLGFDR